MKTVEISKEPIELYKLLKLGNMASSGAKAKTIIAEGRVLVNGTVEIQKRKKINSGDTVEFENEKLHISLQP